MNLPPVVQSLLRPVWAMLLTLATFYFLTPSTLAQKPAAQADTVVLTGRVVSDVDNQPLSDVHILLVDPYFPGQFDVATTNSSGLYTVTEAIVAKFPNLIPGSFYLQFQPDGTHIREFYNDTYELKEATVLTLTVDAVAGGIDASLALGGQIRGKVLAQDSGQPLNKAVITLYDLAGQVVTPDYIVADSDGLYAISGILPGDYKVSARPFYTEPFYVETYYPAKQNFVEGEVLHIAEGQVLTDVDFSLPLGGHIVANVTSNASKQELSPIIEVYDLEGHLLPSKTPYLENHRVIDLLPGEYLLRILDASNTHWPEYFDKQSTLESASPVVVTAGQATNIDVELTPINFATSIATSGALPNTILLTQNYSTTPVYTMNGGQSWQQVATTPWAAPNLLLSPRIGLAPRTGPGIPIRMLAAIEDGEHGLYRTGDNGQSWARQTFPFENCDSYYHFTDPVASPAAPTHLYIGNSCTIYIPFGSQVSVSRLLVSRDAGVTWQEISEFSALGNSSFTNQVFPSPTIADRVYLLGSFPQFENHTRWLQSNNGGESWQAKEFPITELALDGQDSARLYGISVFDYSLENPRFGKRSEDGGEQWVNWGQQPCALGVDPEVEDGFLQLMAHPTQTAVLFLRCTQGLYRSENGGDSWSQLASDPGRLLAPDYGIPGRILWAKDDGLTASTDSGESWQTIMPGYRFTPAARQFPLFLPSVTSDEP